MVKYESLEKEMTGNLERLRNRRNREISGRMDLNKPVDDVRHA